MRPPPNDAGRRRCPSLLRDAAALLGDAEMTGTIFLIALTAVVCCIAAGPSFEIIGPLGILGVWHVLSVLYRRRSKKRRR